MRLKFQKTFFNLECCILIRNRVIDLMFVKQLKQKLKRFLRKHLKFQTINNYYWLTLGSWVRLALAGICPTGPSQKSFSYFTAARPTKSLSFLPPYSRSDHDRLTSIYVFSTLITCILFTQYTLHMHNDDTCIFVYLLSCSPTLD